MATNTMLYAIASMAGSIAGGLITRSKDDDYSWDRIVGDAVQIARRIVQEVERQDEIDRRVQTNQLTGPVERQDFITGGGGPYP